MRAVIPLLHPELLAGRLIIIRQRLQHVIHLFHLDVNPTSSDITGALHQVSATDNCGTTNYNFC
jgi:hypothetical protein